MKNFQSFILEAKFKEVADNMPDDGDMGDAKKNLVSYITSNFYRFINNPDTTDTKGMLMLIAALTMLSSGDDPNAIQAAKRLAQMANIRAGKKGK